MTTVKTEPTGGVDSRLTALKGKQVKVVIEEGAVRATVFGKLHSDTEDTEDGQPVHFVRSGDGMLEFRSSAVVSIDAAAYPAIRVTSFSR